MYTSIGGVTKRLVDFLVEQNGIKQIKEIYAVKEDNTIAKVWEKVRELFCNTFVKYSGSTANTYYVGSTSSGLGVNIGNQSTISGYPNLMGSLVIDGEFSNPTVKIGYEAFGVGTSYIGIEFSPYTSVNTLYYARPSSGYTEQTKTLSGSGDKLYLNFNVPYYRSNPDNQGLDIVLVTINGEELTFNVREVYENGVKIS